MAGACGGPFYQNPHLDGGAKIGWRQPIYFQHVSVDGKKIGQAGKNVCPYHGRLEKNKKNKMVRYLASSSSDVSAIENCRRLKPPDTVYATG
jgi:hypothetical protein